MFCWVFSFDASPVRHHRPGGSPLRMETTTMKKIKRFYLNILNILVNLFQSLPFFAHFLFPLLSLSVLSSLTSFLLSQQHQVIFTVCDQALQKKKKTERKVLFFLRGLPKMIKIINDKDQGIFLCLPHQCEVNFKMKSTLQLKTKKRTVRYLILALNGHHVNE